MIAMGGLVSSLLEGLRALAEPTRLRLLAVCARAELTVSELTRVLGQSQPRVSRHLKLLCDAGVLERFREQTYAFFRVARDGAGARVAQSILALIPADDPVFELDRQRVVDELAIRDKEAAEIMRSLDDELKRARASQPGQSQIDQAVLGMLGSDEIGELLDIGTGLGRMLKLLASDATQAVGIDISPQMLRVARAQIHKAGISDHVAVRHGDMYHLNYPNHSFDTVSLDRVLSFAEQPHQVIAEVCRLLRPDGRLILVELCSEEEGGEGVRPDRLKGLLDEAGLRIGKQARLKGRRVDALVLVGRPRERSTDVAS